MMNLWTTWDYSTTPTLVDSFLEFFYFIFSIIYKKLNAVEISCYIFLGYTCVSLKRLNLTLKRCHKYKYE
jgi:hypothetical protein